MAKYLPEMKKLMEKRLSRACDYLVVIPPLHFNHICAAALLEFAPLPQALKLIFLCSYRLVARPVSLNGNRSVEGILRGYDQFMNVVLDDCIEVSTDGEQRKLGMSVVRGNSIVSLEILPVDPA
jgi:small nuclear ribonucleoprotein G